MSNYPSGGDQWGHDPYGNPANPANPTSGGYPPPSSGAGYGPPSSGAGYGQQPSSGASYGQQPASGAGYGGDPYQQQPPPADPYQAPADPYGQQGGYPPPGPYAPPADPYGQQPMYGGGYGGPPPQKSNTGVIIGIIAVVVVVALIGVGAFLLLKDDDSGDDNAKKSDSSSSTDDSTGPSDDGDNNSGDSGGSGETIAPAGAPYSYKMPSGFEKYTVPSSVSSSSASAIVPDGDPGSNMILVLSLPIPADTLDDIEQYAKETTQSNGISIEGPTSATVDGKKGLTFEFSAQGIEGTYTYIPTSDSSSVIYISCAWSTSEAALKRACTSVKNSMSID